MKRWTPVVFRMGLARIARTVLDLRLRPTNRSEGRADAQPTLNSQDRRTRHEPGCRAAVSRPRGLRPGPRPYAQADHGGHARASALSGAGAVRRQREEEDQWRDRG